MLFLVYSEVVLVP